MGSSSKKAKITAEPTEKVKGLALNVTYDATNIHAAPSWDYTKNSTNTKKNNYFEGVYVSIYADTNVAETHVESKKTTSYKKVTIKNKKLASKKKVNKKAKVSTQYTTGVQKLQVTSSSYFQLKTSDKGAAVDIAVDNYFHPVKGGTYLDCLVAEVQGYNSVSNTGTKKKSKVGAKTGPKDHLPTAQAVCQFYPPVQPEVKSSFDATNRRCTMKQVSQDDGTKHHRRWTHVRYKITKTHDGRTDTLGENSDNQNDADKSICSYDLTFADDNHTINLNEKVVVEAWAMAQGVRGDSGEGHASYTFAYPEDPTFDKPKEPFSGNPNNDILIINFGVSGSNRRTDYFKLQVRRNFFPSDTRKIFSSDDVWWNLVKNDRNWEDVGDKAGKSVRGFVRNYLTDSPDPENPYARTYYRVLAGNEIFDTMGTYRYGPPKCHPEFKHVPSARNEKVDFLEVTPEADGISVRVTLAYTIGLHDGSDEISEGSDSASGSDGTELSWSTDPHAWKSNQGPETFDLPDKDVLGELWYRNPTLKEDGTPNDDQWLTTDPDKLAELKAKYEFTSTAYVRGLTEGTPYYFQARRYLEPVMNGLPRTYGKYASYVAPGSGDGMSAVVPSTKPKTVTVKVPPAIPIGKDLEVSWTFDSEGTQTKWKIYCCEESQLTYKPDQLNASENVPWIDMTSDNVAKLLAEGSDASGYALIPYSTVTKEDGSFTLGVEEFLVDNIVWIAVAMATTGDWSYSQAVRIKYVNAPKAYLGVPQTVVSQPFAITIGSNDSSASATIRISSVDGSVQAFPDGLDSQSVGAIVYSKKYSIEELSWTEYQPLTTESETVYYSNLLIPRGLELYQSQTYEVALTISNEENKLDSLVLNTDGGKDPQTARFVVSYEKDINPPSRRCYVTSDKESLTATIHLVSSEENQTGDLCDIYRVTPDGATLIASDVSYGVEVLDRFAPYSKSALTRYRIASRTPDGQLEWDDYAYNLQYHAVRFDWSDPTVDTRGYTHLEVPYNLDYNDTYKKTFESRHHFGAKRPSGFWDMGVDRTGTIDTPMVKYSDPMDKEALRALASYSGPVMVRRPDGCAYLANVDVNGLKNSYSSPVVTVSFSITEIALTSSFMANTDGRLTSQEDSEYLNGLSVVPADFMDSPKVALVPQVIDVVPEEPGSGEEPGNGTEEPGSGEESGNGTEEPGE